MSTYPYAVGDFYAIGSGIISTTERPESGTVINWAGENFTVQPEPASTPTAVVDAEFDRLLADDTASIGWVHGLPVYTAERLGHLRRIILELLEGAS